MDGPANGQLVIRRPKAFLIDAVRAYRVIIDGTSVGTVRPDEDQAFPLEPGWHEAQLRVDWTGSNAVKFHLEAASAVLLKVEYVGNLLSRTGYLRLVPVPHEAARPTTP